MVLAIIAILVSLLLPTLSKAKRSAHLARCLGNVRQIGLAMKMSVDDAERYPYSVRIENDPASPGNSLRYFWTDDIAPYLGGLLRNNDRFPSSPSGDPSGLVGGAQWTNGVFNCPDYHGQTRFPRRSLFIWGSVAGSYGYNGTPEADYGLQFLGPPVSESQVRVPCDMIETGDANLHGPMLGSDFLGSSDLIPWSGNGFLWKRGENDYWQSNRPETLQTIKSEIERRHGGRYNVGFCDGHSESIRHGELYSKTDDALRRWNYNHEAIP